MSYRITVTPTTFTLEDPLIFTRGTSSDIDSSTRRVSRSAVLDGTVVLTDLGFSYGDKTLVLREKKASEAQVITAKYLQVNYALVVVATWDGVYHGAIESVSVSDGTLILSILVKECISES